MQVSRAYGRLKTEGEAGVEEVGEEIWAVGLIPGIIPGRWAGLLRKAELGEESAFPAEVKKPALNRCGDFCAGCVSGALGLEVKGLGRCGHGSGGAEGEDPAKFLGEKVGEMFAGRAALKGGVRFEVALGLGRQIRKADFQDDLFSGCVLGSYILRGVGRCWSVLAHGTGAVEDCSVQKTNRYADNEESQGVVKINLQNLRSCSINEQYSP